MRLILQQDLRTQTGTHKKSDVIEISRCQIMKTGPRLVHGTTAFQISHFRFSDYEDFSDLVDACELTPVDAEECPLDDKSVGNG
jgi:hypothetical protein